MDLKYAKNASAAGALPWTLLEELTIGGVSYGARGG